MSTPLGPREGVWSGGENRKSLGYVGVSVVHRQERDDQKGKSTPYGSKISRRESEFKIKLRSLIPRLLGSHGRGQPTRQAFLPGVKGGKDDGEWE